MNMDIDVGIPDNLWKKMHVARGKQFFVHQQYADIIRTTLQYLEENVPLGKDLTSHRIRDLFREEADKAEKWWNEKQNNQTP